MRPESEVERLHSRAESLVATFKQGGGSSYIEEAITLDREALDHCLPGHPARSASLIQLALHLFDRYSQLGAMRDLEEAIVLGREALHLCPPGHTNRSTSLNNLATQLFTRYEQRGEMADLDEAIVFDQEALSLRSPGHPDRFMSLSNLAVRLFTRWNRFGAMGDLDEAIAHNREALRICPAGHPYHTVPLNNLAVLLSTRYSRLGAMRDLEESIMLTREALSLRPPGHPDRSFSLISLANSLYIRYNQLGEMQGLDEAIVLDKEALGLCLPGHPLRATLLNNFAIRLFTRYERLGGIQDLDEGIALDREALGLRPPGHPDRAGSLNNLSVRIATRYERLGEMQDLDEAIILSREALDLCGPGQPLRSGALSNLSVHLSTRYGQLGTMQDLDEAIVLDREALDLRPPGHTDRPMSLNNLSIRLSTRYDQLANLRDLDDAIVLAREALDLRPSGNPDRHTSLSTLAACLYTRYRRLKELPDVNEAIVLTREALGLCLPGHFHRSGVLNNLATHLSARYHRLREQQDLHEAIVFAREALDLRPRGHPNRSQTLDCLAGNLATRFAWLKQLKDKEEVFTVYAELAHVPQVVSSLDLATARVWIRAAENLHHPTLLLAYETSLWLLVRHLATLPSLPQHFTILKNHTFSLAVDAFSTCLRAGSPTKAVELLEQGRGVFWSQLIRVHSPIEDVITSGEAGKTLAGEYSRLASRIRKAFNSPDGEQHELVYHYNVEMHKVVTKIRELPGLSSFLLLPPFSDLQRAAEGGPVIVVSASKYSCDALVIFLDRDPVHVPLLITQQDVRNLSTEVTGLITLAKHAGGDVVTRQLAIFLRKLWDQIVRPIVDLLQTTQPRQTRIWWCPTAEFSQLPLHAAGPFRKGQQNLPDLYISSYTPTLAALIRARQSNPSGSVTERKRFLAIGQGQAVGESKLPSVEAELDNIGKCVDDLATFSRIGSEESSISRVIEEFSQSEWVHLACHGIPNRSQPFESAFALLDGRFTIQRIIGCELKNPEFAYLSACHTTAGDKESPDEVIHLASAMQFIGFRSVIGTMWAVDDGHTKKITSTFYRHMVDESGRLDHRRAAYALNKTMKSVSIPLDQRILYIHLGA